MTIEIMVLGWGCILAFVHIFAAIRAKTRQYGRAWNAGARDDQMPPLNPVAGRLARAQTNFFETFPIVIAAILIVEVTHSNSAWSAAGALIWLAARIIYLPIYWAGIAYVRTAVFLLSVIGIAMILLPVLV